MIMLPCNCRIFKYAKVYHISLKGYINFSSLCYLPLSRVPEQRIDTILSTVRNKKESGRARPPLLSLAQILVVSVKR